MTTTLDVASCEDASPTEPRRSSPSRSGSSLSALAFLAFAAIWTALLVAARPFDSNGWWHLTNGSLILRSGSLPAGDPFSWAASGKTAVLDGWLYDVGVAGIARVFGITAISVLALAALVVLGGAVYQRSRSLGSRAWPAAVGAVITLMLVKGFVAERPQVVSYLLFLALIVLAERALAGSNRAWLGAAAVVALWANVHLAFTLGVGVVGLLALAEIIKSRTFARPALVGFSLLGAGLVNPYGARVYLLPFEARDASRIIQEWRPWSAAYGYDLLLLVLVVAVALSLFITRRWRDVAVALPVLFLAVLSADAIRNAPFLLVVAAPELALGLSALADRAARGAPGDSRRRTRSRAIAHGAVIATVVLTFTAFGDLGGFRDSGLPSYPVRATAAIPSGCRLLNEDTFGGYVAEARTADVQVSQDGRQVEGVESLIAQQRVLGAERGWQSWLDRHDVGCVLAAPDRPVVDRLEHLGWERRAADPSAVLLVRPGFSGETRSPGGRR